MKYILILLLTALPSAAFAWGYAPHRGCYWEATEAECEKAKADYEERDRQYKASDEYKERQARIKAYLEELKKPKANPIQCSINFDDQVRIIQDSYSARTPYVSFRNGKCEYFRVSTELNCIHLNEIKSVGIPSHEINDYFCESIDFVNRTHAAFPVPEGRLRDEAEQKKMEEILYNHYEEYRKKTSQIE
ncbi:hypothetical protein PX74_003757 [Salmonella enterica subsp. enterica]|nr:hypothetical protein [Salmonella enterica subsp. enterica]